MRLFAEHQPDELPVVDPTDQIVRGVVSRRHVIDAYNRELMKRDMAAGLGGRLAAARTAEMPVGEDHVMLEVDSPMGLVGRTLSELEVRSRYGVQILLVRRHKPGSEELHDIVPEGSTRIEAGDRLVLLGSRAAVERFRV
jgi:CIC family chloride channel protein